MDILIVDDSSIIIDMVRAMLAEEPTWRVHEAPSGLVAWEMMDGGLVPDLLISDVHMSPMDGLELAGRMRADRRLEAVKIIFLSGDSMRDTVVAAAKVRPSGYLVKPLEQGKILAQIRSVLGKPK